MVKYICDNFTVSKLQRTHSVIKEENKMLVLLIKLAIGAAAGYVATYLMNGKKKAIWVYLVLGIVGAFVGHLLAGLIGISARGIASFLVSVGGSCLVIWFANKFLK